MTCDALRLLGGASSLALVKSDPEHMLDTEVSDCVEELGAMRLDASIARDLWAKIPLVRTWLWTGRREGGGRVAQGFRFPLTVVCFTEAAIGLVR